MSGEPPSQSQNDETPRARVTKRRRFSLIWIVPLVAAAIAGWLLFKNIRGAGPVVTVLFRDGRGLEAGQTAVRYRGVRVGDVRSLNLSQDGEHVEVEVQLDPSAANLAKAGAEFWIVRPEVSAGSIRGLETIGTGAYIQVRPGQGEEKRRFIGLERGPIVRMEEGALEVVLLAPELGSVRTGSPVYYRGVEVGVVQEFLLGSNARTVNLRAQIEARYAPLVRANTKFWNAGGLNAEVSLFGGLDVRASSFKSILLGGIAFATPSPPGERVSPGTLFRLYDKPEDEWQEWSPTIRLPPQAVPGEAATASNDAASSHNGRAERAPNHE